MLQEQIKTGSNVLHEIRGGDAVLVVGKNKIELAQKVLDMVPADQDLVLHVHVETGKTCDVFGLLKRKTAAPHSVSAVHTTWDHLLSLYMRQHYDIVVLSDEQDEKIPPAELLTRLLRPGGFILRYTQDKQ